MQVGDLNVVNSIIDLQSKVMMLESVLNFIIENNSIIIKPDKNIIKIFDTEILKKLQIIYPNMGISKKV